MMKILSNDDSFVLRKISMREIQLDIEDVKGFVIYADINECKLGNVLECDIIAETFTLQTLKSLGTALSYQFEEGTVDVSLQDILCVVTPYFQKKGTVVKLFAKDLQAAEVKLKAMYKTL